MHITLTDKLLQVANTGGQPPLDADKVFSRFYKSDAAARGTGLGLAIVQAICNLYGFGLSYRHEQQQHIFTVVFYPA
ncbi:sensor histidine kinase [Sphingobacterium thalpophilum]|uniref:sensor histidine kinase n=1 Tax=Sphingobacterium thalpophilum TaxID=259 RepID=UPI003C73D2DB